MSYLIPDAIRNLKFNIENLEEYLDSNIADINSSIEDLRQMIVSSGSIIRIEFKSSSFIDQLDGTYKIDIDTGYPEIAIVEVMELINKTGDKLNGREITVDISVTDNTDGHRVVTVESIAPFDGFISLATNGLTVESGSASSYSLNRISGKYAAQSSISSGDSFTIPITLIDGDIVIVIYKNLILTLDKEYTIAQNNITMLFDINAGDTIYFEVIRLVNR